MSRRVVDASIVIKWYVEEHGSTQAIHILEDIEYELCAPDLLLPEAADILWKKHTRGELSRDRMDQLAALIGDPQRLPVRLIGSQPLMVEALSIALEFGRTAYDALYLAAAVQQDAEFVTADAHLANAISVSAFWRARTRLLS